MISPKVNSTNTEPITTIANSIGIEGAISGSTELESSKNTYKINGPLKDPLKDPLQNLLSDHTGAHTNAEQPRLQKRLTSHTSDVLYERDRFRARIHKLNMKNFNSSEGKNSVMKTIKFDSPAPDERSPLDNTSDLFQLLTQEGPLDLIYLDGAQLETIFTWYFNSPLPDTSEMFPWLHGLNNKNYSQTRFFSNRNSDALAELGLAAKPNNARFLMCIKSGDGSSFLKNTINLCEILKPLEFSETELEEYLKEMLPGQSDDSVQEIKRVCTEVKLLPQFLNLDPNQGISLRNFHIQVAKLATCADFIVYGLDPEGIALLLSIAQLHEANTLKLEHKYHAFIAKDIDDVPLEFKTLKTESLETNFRRTEISLENLLPKNMRLWDNDFQLKEKIEACKMSSATKLAFEVWVGNMWDYQVLLLATATGRIQVCESEAKSHLYYDPSNTLVTLDNYEREILKYLPPLMADWSFFVHCRNEASMPTLDELQELIDVIRTDNENSEIYQIEFPSSGSITLAECKKDDLVTILNLCKLIYLCGKGNDMKTFPKPLIYCSDGYTELSLLVLAFIIYCEDVSLDQAMLNFHLKYGRPYYVFNTDVVLLKKLQPLLRNYSPKNREHEIDWDTLEEIPSNVLTELLLSTTYPKSDYISYNLKTLGGMDYNDTDSESESIGGIQDMEDSWMIDTDASLPSRVLPYLYLGSLKHANCLSLLTKLDIKVIVSVGEQLDWINGYKLRSEYQMEIELIKGGQIEIFRIKPGSHSTPSRVYSVETIIKVNNLQDDGKDELADSIPSILQIMQDLYDQSNGEAKMLVHCRVGVSRSATVVIAEVMRRLKISLARAYLYVRVRRLGIIIQPNLKFMYELFKWEEWQKTIGNLEYHMLREVDWFIMCREIMMLNIPYLFPFLTLV